MFNSGELTSVLVFSLALTCSAVAFISLVLAFLLVFWVAIACSALTFSGLLARTFLRLLLRWRRSFTTSSLTGLFLSCSGLRFWGCDLDLFWGFLASSRVLVATLSVFVFLFFVRSSLRLPLRLLRELLRRCPWRPRWGRLSWRLGLLSGTTSGVGSATTSSGENKPFNQAKKPVGFSTFSAFVATTVSSALTTLGAVIPCPMAWMTGSSGFAISLSNLGIFASSSSAFLIDIS